MAGVVFVLINLIGTLAYWHISDYRSSLVDAWFMTVITVFSVGFGEITADSSSAHGRLFTILLIYASVATLLFVTSSVTAFFVEGELTRLLEKRRMEKRLAQMRDHFIVCGAGSTGYHVIHELFATERPVVFIDQDEARVQHTIDELHGRSRDHLAYLVGDASDDEVLSKAGLTRARGLIAALPNDKDNLFITIAARQANPELRIIARAANVPSIEKLKRAGAQSVISPNRIGGMRMVSEMVRPSVVTFLDLMLRDQDKAMRIEEVTIAASSQVAGKSLAAARLRQAFACSVLAVRRGVEAPFDYNPSAETVLESGTVLIVLGSAHSVQLLRAAVESSS